MKNVYTTLKAASENDEETLNDKPFIHFYQNRTKYTYKWDKEKQAFRTYVDQVLDPSMLKMKNLVETSPDKGKYAWEGAYIPQYLVDDAKKRIKHLQQVNNPARLRGGEGGIDEAIEGQIEQAYKSGEGLRGSRYQEILEVDGERMLVESRKGFAGGPDEPLKRVKKER